MAETLPTTNDERIDKANKRVAEQLESIRSMVECDEATKLDVTYFVPKGLRYAAFLSNKKDIVSKPKNDDEEINGHDARSSFLFDEFNIKHISVHQAELELRNVQSQRIAKLMLGKTIKRRFFGTKNIENVNHLIFKAVDPESTYL